MARQLYLCKRALKRHRGPEVRAKEFQVADITEEIWETSLKWMTCTSDQRGCTDGQSYGIWVLRACEVTELKMGDVEINFDTKQVVLKIRKSKTDQAAKGVKRTLVCCGRQSCTRECPLALGHAGRVKRDRAHTARCRAKRVDGGLTGHSARRSGACF